MKTVNKHSTAENKAAWRLDQAMSCISGIRGQKWLQNKYCRMLKHRLNCNLWLKVALDGGTRPWDTLQILPLALAQPPNPRSITSHSLLKVVLDGGTRPGDTLQILPLALAQPPNPRSITSHTVLRGHPSLTNRVGFFRGIQWGIHSQKIIIGTAIFFKENMHSRWKIVNTHTHTIYI